MGVEDERSVPSVIQSDGPSIFLTTFHKYFSQASSSLPKTVTVKLEFSSKTLCDKDEREKLRARCFEKKNDHHVVIKAAILHGEHDEELSF